MKKSRQQAIVITRLQAGACRTAAAGAAGITRQTLHAWLRTDEAFAAAVEVAEQAAVSAVEGALFRAAQQAADDPRYQRSAIFFLKCRAGWQERQVVEPAPALTKDEALDELNAALDRLEAGIAADTEPGTW